MRLLNILPLAVLGAAIVLPDEQVISNIAIESTRDTNIVAEKLPCPHHLLDNVKGWWKSSKKTPKDYMDEVLGQVNEASSFVQDTVLQAGFDVESWLESSIDSDHPDNVDDHPHGPPSHGPPGHGPPRHGPPGHGPPGHGPPGRKRPGKGPHKRPGKGKIPQRRPHHGHKSNLTIYEMISKSKYTTKLAKLVEDDKDLIKILNSTEANFTLFAPTDHAFSKIPEGAHPPKELIKKVLLYHISPGFYPAGRLLFSHTVPTLLNETLLGNNSQRLVAKVGLRGVAINFYSKVVAVNIPAVNGIIHGVDSIIIPPPKTLQILNLLPGEFSTLLLGLGKTGLAEVLNSTAHAGGTFFAPSNTAFKKLGPRINAFLFSKFGEKYLNALLEYHVVANQTLYSNTFYPSPSSADIEVTRPPYVHLDLPTLLPDKSLAIDLTRYGPFSSFKINGFVRVVVQDGIAKDGVIQIVSDVLIPPKAPGGPGGQVQYWGGEEMDVEEFKERLGPFVVHDKDEEIKMDL